MSSIHAENPPIGEISGAVYSFLAPYIRDVVSEAGVDGDGERIEALTGYICDLAVKYWDNGWRSTSTVPCEHDECPRCTDTWMFTCCTCGDRARAVSKAQAEYARDSDEVQCSTCYKAGKRAGRLEDLETIGSQLNESMVGDAGTLVIRHGVEPGGFVYWLYNDDGAPLYIGSTERNLWERVREHRNKPWWIEVSSCRYQFYTHLDAARLAERVSINVEEPAHNKLHV